MFLILPLIGYVIRAWRRRRSAQPAPTDAGVV
jgi:hypothetical protein